MAAERDRKRWGWAALSLLLVVALVVLFTDPWSKMPQDSRRVVLRDPGRVDSIVVSGAYDSVILVKKQGTWLLFGEEEVNPVAVENLLYAASRWQIHSIESGGEGDRETGEPGSAGFYAEGEPLRTYRLSRDNDRFAIRLPGQNTTYHVSVAGYRDLRLGRVFSEDPDHYRQHLLIDLLPSEVREIGVKLPSGVHFRFLQDRTEEVVCLPGNRETELPDAPLNEAAVRRLFSYFTPIRYESRSGIPSDTLGKESPLATVRVVPFDGPPHTLAVYPYPEEPGGPPRMFEALVVHNQEPEALVINYIYLDVLMRGMAHYFGGKR